jgi:nucleotide-binding universal stress UspA family protein
MKKILVAVDFSGVSRNAEKYAVSLAKAFGAEMQLLHVYKELMPATVGPEPWSITTSELRVENEKLINKEIGYLKVKCGIDVKGNLETGARGRTINAFAKRIGADFIVMGVRSGRKKILRSTVLNTVRKTKLPVLIVPDGEKFVSIKYIVIAVDFTEMLDSSCFDALYEIYKKFDSLVHVLHVENPDTEIEASEVPEKLHLGLTLSRFNYQYQKTESYNVEEAIRGFTDKHPTDLLVLIAHHHTIYERIFETMHTTALSFKIEKPLLILRSQLSK